MKVWDTMDHARLLSASASPYASAEISLCSSSFTLGRWVAMAKISPPYRFDSPTVKIMTHACVQATGHSSFLIFMSTPLGGGHIIFAFSAVRRPASAVCRPASHLVSGHFKQGFLTDLYQIWHGGILGGYLVWDCFW